MKEIRMRLHEWPNKSFFDVVPLWGFCGTSKIWNPGACFICSVDYYLHVSARFVYFLAPVLRWFGHSRPMNSLCLSFHSRNSTASMWGATAAALSALRSSCTSHFGKRCMCFSFIKLACGFETVVNILETAAFWSDKKRVLIDELPLHVKLSKLP